VAIVVLITAKELNNALRHKMLVPIPVELCTVCNQKIKRLSASLLHCLYLETFLFNRIHYISKSVSLLYRSVVPFLDALSVLLIYVVSISTLHYSVCIISPSNN